VPTDQSRSGGGRADSGRGDDTQGDSRRDQDEAGAGTADDRAAGEVSVSHPETDTADTAAASALARAREAARARGLRPGSKPLRKRHGQSGRDLTDSGRDGRDPSLLGDQMDRLLLDRGWNIDVAIGAVMGRWPAIVGDEVAAHCTPVTFQDGVLVVRADSTAWATQLRLLSSSILGRLEKEVGKDTVTELRVQGPSAPSWSHGPRKSTGPGPRDTYG
jgi:predicted nucleic acid-binding Zn ribbon protein